MLINIVILLSVVQIAFRNKVFALIDVLENKRATTNTFVLLAAYILLAYALSMVLYFYSYGYLSDILVLLFDNHSNGVFSSSNDDMNSASELLLVIRPLVLLIVMVLQTVFIVLPLTNKLRRINSSRK